MTDPKKYDVFLCHNSKDKPAVIELVEKLKEWSVKTWLDDRDLLAGLTWWDDIKEQIANSHAAAAVCIGKNNIGSTQYQEISSILGAFEKRKFPIIPVILHDAPKIPADQLVPEQLRKFTWVDFRPNVSPLLTPLWQSCLEELKPLNQKYMSIMNLK
jgi:hypothetical protein